MKALLVFLLYFSFVVAAAANFVALDLFKRNDLVLPRTVLADMDLTGLSREETRNLWMTNYARFLDKPLRFAARGEIKSVTPRELGVKIAEQDLFSNIPFAGSVSNAEMLLWSIAGQRIYPKIMLDKTEVLRVMEEKFPSIPNAQNAHFILRNGVMEINEAKTGMELAADKLTNDIKQNAAFFDSLPLIAEFRETKPTVSQLDLEVYKDSILNKFPRDLVLLYEKQKWTVNFREHPDWIEFERRTSGESQNLPFIMKWKPVSFANFLKDNLVESVEQDAQSVKIWTDDAGNAQFEGHEKEGRAIDRQNLFSLSNEAIEFQTREIQIPLVVVKPKIEISEDLQNLGIREMISVGHTRFEGSPPNRIHNIGVGVSRFNGILIAPGETFSFSKYLGPVDASTGYRKELVIKPEGTIPEFGGGLCQVSTTMYRAALYGGLPIVERTPHTYAVRYYAQVGGHGLDATVYPPSPDLKFINDTSGYILIHSYVEGMSAYFKFFGTLDDRITALDGPYISNQRKAPAEPMLIADLKLKPGERKQVEKPHDGFDTVWYRYITKNGATNKETIVSRYQAIPAKFLVGGQPPEQQPAEGGVVNPYE